MASKKDTPYSFVDSDKEIEEATVTEDAAQPVPAPEEETSPAPEPTGKEHWGQGGEYKINEAGFRVRV
jgi:hypothetical protein